MSLLPNQIIPETVALGRVNEDGTVTIDHNWWLFLYNLFLNVLASGNVGPAAGDILASEVYLRRITLPLPGQPDMLQIMSLLPRLGSNVGGSSSVNFSDEQNILANQIFGR